MIGAGSGRRGIFLAAAVLFITTLSTAWVAPLFDPDRKSVV